ncbi:Uncharacterized protein HZ326_23543 [Fusarium oxysporum f. sp. albedinis]|nr:Uncharacterized protein HZ326_24931 [Fusarium oxysporum f. sp. albedinis]KAJ0133389.1 Uncharacterized protein HZ326_23543 [Fusarium oxysporum f. sp. albedinis]
MIAILVVSWCHSFRRYSFLEIAIAKWERETRDNGNQSESEPKFALENNEHCRVVTCKQGSSKITRVANKPQRGRFQHTTINTSICINEPNTRNV